MTEIERKALAMLDEVCAERGLIGGWHKHARETHTSIEALCRAIEQHEAFRKEVSDAVERFFTVNMMPDTYRDSIGRFIIVKPDPLVEVAEELRETYCATGADWAKATRAALAKRGLEIREIEG